MPTAIPSQADFYGKTWKTRNPRKKRLPRPLAPRYPTSIEREYQRELAQYVALISRTIGSIVLPQIPGLVSSQEISRPAALRTDAEPKYYTAFIYNPVGVNPDILHCTHVFLGELSEENLNEVVREIDQYFLKPRKLPRVSFTREEFFGPEKDIRVLTPENIAEDPFFPELRETLYRFKKPDFNYRPHVSTQLHKMDLNFHSFALITKAGIVKSWPRSRLDAVSDDIDDLFDQVGIIVDREMTPDEIRRLAQRKGFETSSWNKDNLRQNFRRVLGIDPIFADAFLENEMALFTVSNVNLITSIKDEALRSMKTSLFEQLRSGVRAEEISESLRKYIDPSVGNVRARADLIARDQIGKFNGQLAQLRQSEVGVSRYRWRTVGDERVRESHREKDGNIYSWDDPPADTGHPGEDYQCRCYGEPVFEDVVPGFTAEEDEE